MEKYQYDSFLGFRCRLEVWKHISWIQAGSLEPYKFQILGFLSVYFQQFWNIFNDEKLSIIDVLQKSYFENLGKAPEQW